MAHLIDAIEALRGSGTRVMIGLVGPPGVGKSTVAQALSVALGQQGATVAVVPMDGFHLANAELARLGLSSAKGRVDTFDGWGYAALLRRLRANTEPVVYAPIYDRGIEESVGSALPVRQDIEVVITEGNYLLLDDRPWTDAAAVLDQTWYLDLDDDLRRSRLIARHEQVGKAPEAARAWVESVDQPNAQVIAATRHRATLAIEVW